MGPSSAPQDLRWEMQTRGRISRGPGAGGEVDRDVQAERPGRWIADCAATAETTVRWPGNLAVDYQPNLTRV